MEESITQDEYKWENEASYTQIEMLQERKATLYIHLDDYY